MPRGVRNTPNEADAPEAEDAPAPEVAEQPAAKMATMRLQRNYVPIGKYEVVSAPDAPYPGAGYANKLWAGTVVRLPEAEAKGIYAKGIATRDFD